MVEVLARLFHAAEKNDPGDRYQGRYSAASGAARDTSTGTPGVEDDHGVGNVQFVSRDGTVEGTLRYGCAVYV
jgi:hypothetical protein